MKRFFSAVCLCGCLLAAGLFFFSPASEAGNNVLAELLSLPAPPPPNPLMTSSRGDRPDDFYNKSKPPKDDAPLDELLDYWQKQNATYERLGYNPKPSPETLRRLLKACEEHPEKFQDFLSLFPADANIAEKIKSFYDKDLGDNKLGDAWQRSVKQWLTYNSKYFVDKLIKKARAVQDQNEYVTNQEELLALAKVDWDSAKPILDNMLYNANQPASVTLAKWAFYLHALDAGDQGDIEKYRDQLKAVVEDKNAPDGMRDLAFDALVKEADWEGRDDWYLTLLEDESLFDLRVNGQSYTGLTTLVLYSPPEKYSKKMLELLKSNSLAVRNAAVRNLAELVQKGDVEVIKGLLPWLHDPKWAKEASGERRALVNALKSVQIPESVPGLIAVLNERTVAPRYSANSNMAALANRPAYNAVNSAMNAGSYEIGEAYPLRDLAIYALVTQKDARAVPALRAVLPQVDGYMREQVVRGILGSNGFPVAEQLNGIEVTLKAIEQAQETLRRSGLSNTRANTATIEDVPDDVYLSPSVMAANHIAIPSYNPSLLPRILGGILMNETEVSEGLVLATVNRMEALEKTDPKMSNALRAVMEKWRGPAMNLVALKELKNGTISLQLVIRLLGQRKELRETQINEVMDARGGTPFAYGIAACLLEDNSDYETILSSGSTESRTAMLGCARMIRASLPLAKVAENLKSADKLLATAAERYLESEDSPAARQIILAHFPNTSRIMGARTAFEVDGAEPTYNAEELAVLFSGAANAFAGLISANDEPLISEEKRLRKELDDNKELLGIYAYNDNYIRIYADRVMFSWEEDVSRYWERALKKEEFESFRNYLVDENVDEFPPFLSYCDYCEGVEFLMFGRAGGRRVYIRGDEEPKFKKDMDQIFAEMRTPPAKLHYWLEKYLPGLEIMYTDENLQARTLWKNGDDFRLLIEDAPRRQQMQKEIERSYEGEGEGEGEDAELEGDTPRPVEGKPVSWQERRQKAEREGFFWYKFVDGRLSELVAQPPGVEYFPPLDGLPGTPMVGQWKARTPGFEIRADYEGLYKITGGRSTKIKEDIYSKPVVTPNGRWVIVTKVSNGYEPGLVRINLLTGKEFKIDLPKYFRNEAVAYIPSLNKVLLFGGNYEYEGEGEDYEGEEEAENPETGKGNHYLLDADTGILLDVSASEVRPLKQQTFRALQPAGTPDTFWAAIPDENKGQTQFGIYNAKTLLFKNLLTIPQIQFGSMNTWVDEKEGKLYFVYEGHLLRLPLPQSTAKPAGP